MARSEEQPNESILDSDSPPLSEDRANPGTEPHTAPSLTTEDRRKTEPSASAVYDDRRQRAVDPHADTPAAGTAYPTRAAAGETGKSIVDRAVDKVLDAVEPRRSPTGTMGASGEQARHPDRDP